MDLVELPPRLAVTAQVGQDRAQQHLRLFVLRMAGQERPHKALRFNGSALLTTGDRHEQARGGLGRGRPGGLASQALALAEAPFEQGLASLPYEHPPLRSQ